MLPKPGMSLQRKVKLGWICTMWGGKPHYQFSKERDLQSLRRYHETFFTYRVENSRSLPNQCQLFHRLSNKPQWESQIFLFKVKLKLLTVTFPLRLHYPSPPHGFPFRWMDAGLGAPWSCCRSCFGNMVPSHTAERRAYIHVCPCSLPLLA